ncbi:MAG: efflux transporter outer membrane subunit [Campylobacterota bacterium]|nr:efflux transporter outer membrane subunit [Campylobacterota bacterium]
MKIYYIVALLVSLFINGCTTLGPDFEPLKSENIPKEWEKNQKSDTTEWWKIFGDSLLNTLVEKTYIQNLDIQSAGLRILQARAALGVSEGLKFPQQQTLSGSAAASHGNSRNFGSVGLKFDTAWEMDVWGKYARGVESSEASLYASVASYDDIMISVISEMARNYINYRMAQERIVYARRNIKIQERVTEITKIQFNSGNVSELDMQQSLSQLHSTRSLLPTFNYSMIQSRNAMAILLGITPNEMQKILRDSNKEKKIIPHAIYEPLSTISAELIKNRPDIRVAEHLAHANSAKIGAAEAGLYPSFVLFGNIGISANDALGSWGTLSDSVGVSIGPSFSWNIFQYDRIKNQIRFQDAIFEESLVNFNKKVLIAVGEVSNSLEGFRLTKLQRIENQKALAATQRAYNISMEQYSDGLVGYQRLSSSLQSLTIQEDNYAQIQAASALHIIALYKALGGGWKLENSKPYISKKRAKKMKERTDWGDYLDD